MEDFVGFKGVVVVAEPFDEFVFDPGVADEELLMTTPLFADPG